MLRGEADFILQLDLASMKAASFTFFERAELSYDHCHAPVVST